MAEAVKVPVPEEAPASLPARAKKSKSKLPAPPKNAKPAEGSILSELGISGTVNYDGRIQAEANPVLRDFSARGSPGVGNSWGVWEKIRWTDPAVASAINLVAAPLRDATVEVEPAEDVAGAEEHAALVHDNLLKWLDPQWSTFIEETVDVTLTSGFDIHEPVMGTREDPRVPGGLAVYVAKLAQRLPSSLGPTPWKEKGGELEYIQQQGNRSTPDGRTKFESDIRLPADKILLTSWNRAGNNYEGRSALRSVYYLTKLREALLKIFAIGSEREALGIPVGTTDKDAKITTAQLREWQTWLQNIAAHENAAAVPPPGMSFDWKFSPGANKGHVLDAWERLGKVIHMVFLTQQVTLGVDGTGSRAVGEVHDATKNEFVNGVKALIEGTLNGVGKRPYTGLAQRIIIPNFGPQSAYPRIKLVMKRAAVSIGELASAVPAFVTAGLLTPTVEDENQLRDKMGWAPIDPAVREAEIARKQQVAQAIAGAMPKDGEEDEDEDEEPGKKGPPKPGPKLPPGPPVKGPPAAPAKLSERGNPGSKWKRSLYSWEMHLDLANIETTLNRRRDAFVEEAGALLTAAIAEQLPAIKRQMNQADQSKPVQVDLDLSKLGSFVEAFIQDSRIQGYSELSKEMRRQPAHLTAAGKAIHLEEEEDRATVPDETESAPQTSSAKRRKVGQRIERMRQQLLTRMRARVIDDIESEADFLAHQTAGDPADIVKNVVARALENRGLKYEAASIQARAFSMGREEFAAEHAEEIAAVRYSAILDSNTCSPCNAMDGREFEYGSAEHDAAVPPFGDCKGGDQCRCMLVMVFKPRGGDGFRKVEEAPES